MLNINALAVRKLRISYTSQNDDHGLGTLGRTLLASSVADSKKSTSHSNWPCIPFQIHPLPLNTSSIEMQNHT